MTPKAVAVLSLALLLIAPTASADEASESEALKPTAPADTPVNGYYVFGGILTISAGLGLAAAGTWALIRADQVQSEAPYEQFVAGVPANLNSCDAARNGTANDHYRLLDGAYLPSEMVAKCDEVDDLVTLEVVAFPTSMILAGLGTYLLLEAVGLGYDNLALAPVVTPDYQGAGATITF